MRVVVDTNVLVSGVLNPHGSPGQIVDAILADLISVLYDDRILDEYREVMMRPAFGFRRADVEAFLQYVELAGELVRGHPLKVTLPDPSDLPFLEVAAAGHADALVTGNRRHFRPIKGHCTVTIVSPAELTRKLTA